MTLLKDQAHMTTHRGADKRILKTAKDAEGIWHLSNEIAFLATMSPSGYVPKFLNGIGPIEAPTSIFLEDLGDSEPVTDNDVVLTHAIHLLNWLRTSRVRHGDLTAPNIIIRKNKPHVIDFSEAIDMDAPPTRQPKRPEPDWFHLLQAIRHHGDPRRIIRRWMAIRESLSFHSLEDKRMIDFGCHEGYMVGLAAADGASAIGIDKDRVVCKAASERWKGLYQKMTYFTNLDINEWKPLGVSPSGIMGDFALCLSTYPYLIQAYGEEKARLFLARIVKSFDAVFFEAQSSGDGPGPAFWKDQEAVGEYLSVFGAVEEVCRLRIAGRDAERVTWKVVKN